MTCDIRRATALLGAVFLGACADATEPAPSSPSAQVVWTDDVARPGSVSVRAIGPTTLEVTGVVSGTCLAPGPVRARASRDGATVVLTIDARVANSVCQVENAVQYRAQLWLSASDTPVRAVSLRHQLSGGRAMATDTTMAIVTP